jgi:hypothetical protein
VVIWASYHRNAEETRCKMILMRLDGRK